MAPKPKPDPNQSTLDAFFKAKPVAAALAAAAKPSAGSAAKDGAASTNDASPQKRSALPVDPCATSGKRAKKQLLDETQPAAAKPSSTGSAAKDGAGSASKDDASARKRSALRADPSARSGKHAKQQHLGATPTTTAAAVGAVATTAAATAVDGVRDDGGKQQPAAAAIITPIEPTPTTKTMTTTTTVAVVAAAATAGGGGGAAPVATTANSDGGAASAPETTTTTTTTMTTMMTTRKFTVQWEGESHQIVVPAQPCTLEECLHHFHAKTNIDSKIAEAKEPWKSKLVQVKSLSIDFFTAQYSNNNLEAWDLRLRNLVGTAPCGYFAEFYNGNNKNGMTFRGRDRIVEQKDVRVAALLMTLEEMHAQVPHSAVDTTVALRMPGLQFYPSAQKQQYLRDLIVSQFSEAFLACHWGLGTGTILERLMQVPSAKVEATLAPIAEFGQDVLDFKKGMAKGSVAALLTWPHLPSAMREMAKTSEFLQAHIHEAPTEGGFVTLHQVVNVYDDMLGSWQDAVEVCPRLVQLDHVVSNLTPLLQGDIDEDESTSDAILSALTDIQDGNYRHYVPPSEQDLAKDTRRKLDALFTSLPNTQTIYLERVSYKALKNQCPDWLAANIDLSSEIALKPDRALSLLRSKTGHHIEVTSSCYFPFTDVATTEQRFKGTMAIAANLDLQQASGHKTEQEVFEKKAILRSYLMALEHASGDFQMALL